MESDAEDDMKKKKKKKRKTIFLLYGADAVCNVAKHLRLFENMAK
jgi:hypothetical protein